MVRLTAFKLISILGITFIMAHVIGCMFLFFAAVDESWKTPESRLRLAKELVQSSALVLGAAVIGLGLAWAAVALIEGFYSVRLRLARTPEPPT